MGIVTSNGIQTVQNMSFVFNDIGHLTQRQDNSRNLTENFSYDGLNRLLAANVTGGTQLSMQYDVLGNIIYKSDVGTYHYAQNGEGPKTLTSITPNSEGLCIPSAITDYQYTSFDKVRIIEQGTNRLEIDYGADRQRIVQRTYQYDQLVSTRTHIGSLYEKIVTDTLTKEVHYIRGGSGVVAVYNKLSNGTNQTNYWHKDHLGSVQVITDDMGVVRQELSYDAWGKRRKVVDWSPMDELPVLVTPRGFTGHEHLDLFGLVNMNGRVYDPVLGRFISADPNVQDYTDLQNLNRYSYVLNNPLSYTDPSGYIFKKLFKSVKKFFKKHWKTIVTLAVSAVLSYFIIGPAILALGLKGSFLGTFLSGAGLGFGSSFTGSLLSGASIGDALKAGLRGAVIGGVVAGATFGVGSLFEGASAAAQTFLKPIAHGIVQGVAEEVQGGEFVHGFLAGAFTTAAEGTIELLPKNTIVRTVAAAIVGGTAAELGGGKFSNGAASGAFVYMFNHAAHTMKHEQELINNEFHKESGVLSADKLREKIDMLDKEHMKQFERIRQKRMHQRNTYKRMYQRNMYNGFIKGGALNDINKFFPIPKIYMPITPILIKEDFNRWLYRF